MVEMIGIVTTNLDIYVPGYDDSDSYEIKGIVWMQGWNDAFHDACTMITTRNSQVSLMTLR